MSGVTPACSRAKSVPVRPKAGHDLIQDHRDAVRGHAAAHGAQELRAAHAHARGALHQRLGDERGHAPAVALQEGVQSGQGGGLARLHIRVVQQVSAKGVKRTLSSTSSKGP